MIDHDPCRYALIARSFDGLPEGLTPDDILDNVTHYWLTNTGVSSGRPYWEYKGSYFDKNVISGLSQPVNWIVADIVRMEDGILVEHWDVIQDEVTQEQSKSGLPMFGEKFPDF